MTNPESKPKAEPDWVPQFREDIARTRGDKISYLMSMGFLADRLLIDGRWSLLGWSEEEVEQCRTTLEKLGKRTLELVEELRGPRY